MENNSVKTMCDQIVEEATKEAQAVVRKAQTSADQRIRLAKQQADSTAQKILKSAEEESMRIRKKILSSLSMEKQKLILKKQGELTQQVILRVKDELKKLPAHKNYIAYLKASLKEAVLAFDSDCVSVMIGEHDPISAMPQIIKALEKELAISYSKKININLHKTRHAYTGIIVNDTTNHIRINNTLEERLTLRTEEIRRLIFQRLFEEDQYGG